MVLGTHLKDASEVTFNGKTATFKVLSDTHMTATVPADATTGPIHVVTPYGELESRKTFVIQER